jgi:membrane-associated protease RseP (regulator of RpoE activity)
MADLQTISAFVFLLVLCLLLYKYRKKLITQQVIFPFLYVILYKTKIGIKLMEKMANRFPRLIRFLGYLGVLIGFVGMVLIAYLLIQNLLNIIMHPASTAGVALVLPFKVKGSFYVPFFYWIISIFIIAVVHEFSHGVVSKAHNIKIKSSGLAFLAVLIPVLPAAFVEPDEKKLSKSPAKKQLSVFAAGPFSNILLGIIALLIFIFLLVPAGNSILDPIGMEITSVEQNYSAYNAGMRAGEVVIGINGQPVDTLYNFTTLLGDAKPGDRVAITTNRTSYSVVLGASPKDPEMPHLGVFIQQKSEITQSFIDKYGSFAAEAILWFVGLFYWLYLLNIGIGLFNLLPLGPLDGGRMLYTALLTRFDKKRATNIWKNISAFFLIVIIINLFVAFV